MVFGPFGYKVHVRGWEEQEEMVDDMVTFTRSLGLPGSKKPLAQN